MTSYGIYRINENKCATCAFWGGPRSVECRANKPFYINAQTGNYDCLVQKGKKTSSVYRCLKYLLWEKVR
jgi:hypothetical protein